MCGCEGRPRVTEAQREREKKEKNKQPEKTHTQRCQTEFKSIKKNSHKGVTALSASALDAECGNTFGTTLPVSTNIGLALGSHMETPVRARVRSTVRAASSRREKRDAGFIYRRDERARLPPFRGKRRWRQTEPERVQRGGTWGDQSSISESIPCWTV